MSSFQRPLSPHLQVYKPQISSVLSILHRLTGLFLALGGYVLVIWLSLLAFDTEGFVTLSSFFGTLGGHLILGAWTAAFFYHFCNGVRHLFWDMGLGYGLATMTKSGWSVVALTVILTTAVWVCVFIRWGF